MPRFPTVSSPGLTALVLACAIFAVCLLMTRRTTLWDRDEPQFAQASVEMVRSGQYLYPTLGGQVFAQKPILIYWLMALSVNLLGVSEIAVRFWAPVALALTAYATWTIGRRLLSARAGVWAMLVVTLNPLAIAEGQAATIDAVLMALITCAIAAFVWRLTSKDALAPAALFASALAGALLAKGPVGLLPVLVVVGTLWPSRDLADARTIAMEFGQAAAVAVALFAFWSIAANTATGGRFYSQGFQREIVERALSPLDGHGGNPLLWLPFYPAVLVIGLAPWSAYIPAALHGLWRRDRVPGAAPGLLTWWIAGPLVAFSLAATHLPHYILPAWPALALAIASILDEACDGRADAATRRWLAFGLPLGIVPVLLACSALIAVPFVIHAPELIWRSVSVIVMIVAATIVVVRAVNVGDFARAFAVCLTAAIAFLASMGFWWLPGVERVKPVPRIAALVRARGAMPVATLGFGEPSLDFYLSRTPDVIESAQALQQWSEDREPGILVTTRDTLGQMGPVSLHEIGSSAGFNVTNGRAIELVALERLVR